MHINITAAHHHDKLIPKFFREEWKKMHGVDPVGIAETNLRMVRTGFRLFWVGVFFLAVACLLVVYYGARDWKVYPPAGLGLSLAVFGLWAMAVLGERNAKHNVPYFDSLSELFSLFRITPCVELYDMSREEFSGYIAELLKKGGEHLNKVKGFEKVRIRGEFKRAHAVAYSWKLCEEKWDSYFPKK